MPWGQRRLDAARPAPPPLVTTSQGRGSSCLLSGSPQGEVGGTGALPPGEPPPCSFSRPVHLGGCPVLFGAGGLMERLREGLTEGLTEDFVAGTALGPPLLWECRQLTQSQLHKCLHTHPLKSGPKNTVSLRWALHWGCAGDVVRPALGLQWAWAGPAVRPALGLCWACSEAARVLCTGLSSATDRQCAPLRALPSQLMPTRVRGLLGVPGPVLFSGSLPGTQVPSLSL